MKALQSPACINPHELHRLLAENGAIDLLDVRTPGEHARAHPAGARLIPLDELDCAAFLKQRDANDKPIYLLCQSGGRARKAIEGFHRAGFEGCVLVEGGMDGWTEARLPVVRGQSRVLPLMRQVQIAVGLVSGTGAVLALSVDYRFAILPLLTACGLVFAGVTGICGLGLLLARMPWNRRRDCCGVGKELS
jgi:rhodanese-related sulfurtransferase